MSILPLHDYTEHSLYDKSWKWTEMCLLYRSVEDWPKNWVFWGSILYKVSVILRPRDGEVSYYCLILWTYAQQACIGVSSEHLCHRPVLPVHLAIRREKISGDTETHLDTTIRFKYAYTLVPLQRFCVVFKIFVMCVEVDCTYFFLEMIGKEKSLDWLTW